MTEELAANAEVEVLIVGGGPVGLTARALLERWGVRTLLVEKHAELSPFPRSRLVNVRSMEIYRQLGLEATISARAFAPEYGRIRFRDTLQDRDFATAGMVGINAPIPESPVVGVVTSQDRLEPTLLAAADTPVRFGVELIDLVEEAEGVTAVFGDQQNVRARYVIAADGTNSTVRQLLGIGTVGPGALADFTTVVFDADLDRWCAGQPAGVYFTPHGTFAPLYPEGGWALFTRTSEGPDWHGVVARAVGADDVRADVLRVQHWVMNAFIAERFSHGRVLLAGDAAHAIPIIGGLGMNAGIADVHNLCWKLAGVLRGWARPSLLDTYETERHPVAQRTLHQAVANTQLAVQVQTRRREQLEAGEAAQTQTELPWSDQYFAQLGLVLGVAYRSDGGTPPEPSGTDYIPVAEPGHRMPHHWLTENRSTLDTVGAWFTLLTPNGEQQTATPWPLHTERTDLCGQGALLVRPDGHIGAVWPDGPPSDTALQHALAAITGSLGTAVNP